MLYVAAIRASPGALNPPSRLRASYARVSRFFLTTIRFLAGHHQPSHSCYWCSPACSSLFTGPPPHCRCTAAADNFVSFPLIGFGDNRVETKGSPGMQLLPPAHLPPVKRPFIALVALSFWLHERVFFAFIRTTHRFIA
jgi:hypothetical protein